MPDSATFSVRLPAELRRAVDDFAKASRRSRSFVVKEAVTAYMDEQRAYLAAIDAAEREVEAGDTIPGDEIVAWLRSWGKPDELPPPSLRKLHTGS